MDAPPPSQPDAAAAAAAPSSTSTSASSAAPPPKPPASAASAAPSSDSTITTPTPTPNPGTAANPTQTLEAPGPSAVSARPPPPRMRPPYTHLASPITMSSFSSAATTATSSSASVPPSSSAAPPIPRGGVVMGIPAPRPAQTPAGYTGFVPPPPLAHQFGSMHRGPDQSPPSSSQFRPPSPGIQNIGMVGSLSASQMRPGIISGPQQPRPGLPSSTTPIPSGSQMPGSQRTPSHALMRPMSVSSPAPSPASQQTPQNSTSAFRPQQRPQVPQPRPQQSAPVTPHQQNIISAQQQQQKQQQQSSSHQIQQNSTPTNQPQHSQQQAARTAVAMTQKPDSPAIQNATVLQSVNKVATDADVSETGTRLLTKRSIHELVAQIDPNEKLDPEVEDVLMDIAEDFVESVTTFACSLAKHRKSNTLEAKDVLLHAERSWNITLPGFSGDEIKLYKKQHINDIHRERLALIKKSMATDTRNSAAQAAANQKNQTPKPPAPASP
ncbi:transcription initiation factor TFIID subunit 12-like isoform X2 [Panicum virgatum]|uniref:transcription initiation factor TFIID subunit 12-like isoform X2 n=1 Tax=Panicum virgatum TaxID=38727 RepID=UPI0019D5BDC3|nr:transcription initiation factor TFIID subunit 12-like isoform X2 [Panicum virgatum]